MFDHDESGVICVKNPLANVQSWRGSYGMPTRGELSSCRRGHVWSSTMIASADYFVFNFWGLF